MTDVTNSGEAGDVIPDANGSGKKPDGEIITMTPAQLKVRLDRAQAAAVKDFADYDDLKAAAKKLAELEEAQKSELEKAQDAAKKAQEERDAALKQAQDTLIRAEFVAEAAKVGAAHPEDAYALADKAGVIMGEDGKISGVVEAVRALVDADRLVLGKKLAPSLDGGAGSGNAPGGEKPLSTEELAAAKKMGLTPEQYAKGKRKTER